jgi:regulatory protein
MKITQISQQIKQQDRYSIYVDGKYAFSLSASALLESQLVRGQQLSEGELQNWKRQSSEDKISNQALRYAALRPHSRWEMQNYLKRKTISPALTQKILNKLTDISLLDDLAFARSWVANRRLLRPTSKRKLQQELRAKRVDDEVIDQVLAEDETTEQDVLRELIAKKRQLSKYKVDDLKLMQYLATQGFNYGDIKNILGENKTEAN